MVGSITHVRHGSLNYHYLITSAVNRWKPDREPSQLISFLIGLFCSGEGLLNDIWILEGTASEADANPSAGGCGSSDFNLIALHGLFMFLGWGVFLQAGAFIARYFRHKDPWWFKMHRGIQVSPW